jgi:hypothetical protein
MSKQPEHGMTYAEAQAVAAEIKETPGCELEGMYPAEGGRGYIVDYWPLREDGSRANYGMVVFHPEEWANLKRIALAHEAKRQRRRERQVRGDAKPGEDNSGPA